MLSQLLVQDAKLGILLPGQRRGPAHLSEEAAVAKEVRQVEVAQLAVDGVRQAVEVLSEGQGKVARAVVLAEDAAVRLAEDGPQQDGENERGEQVQRFGRGQAHGGEDGGGDDDDAGTPEEGCGGASGVIGARGELSLKLDKVNGESHHEDRIT